MFFRSQAFPLRKQSNMRLTCCLAMYCLLRDSTEYQLWNFLRSENSWMSTSARSGSGPATLLMGAPFFWLGKKWNPKGCAWTIGLWNSKQDLMRTHYPGLMIVFLILTILVALNSTLVIIRLQSAQEMSTKQLSCPGMVRLRFLYCHLA